MANRLTYRCLWLSCATTFLSWHLYFLPALAQTPPAPLHQRIDAMLDQYLAGPRAAAADDATLVRRLYLDLTGAIPSGEEARRFIEDSSPEKWGRLVDALLADPRFVDHMTDYWDVAMMERHAEKHVKSAEWRGFLEQALKENRPFDQLAADILSADGSDPKARGPARFYLDREAEPNRLTRDIGRVFFGVDLQCAQCHDHPLIDDYYQADYYGLYAFVSRLSLYADKKKKISYLSEKADGEVKFTSVFTSESGRANPRLPFVAEVGSDPAHPAGDEYKVKPGKETAGVPKYSRRLRLAEEVSKGQNPAFRRNIANRLWAVMMGRGLVHPVDLHHSDNPASHPELLRLLSGEIAAMNFDMRAFVKEIALTQAYQRDYKLPPQWHTLGAGHAEQQAAWQAEVEKALTQLKAADAAFEQTVDKLSAARQECFTADDGLTKLKADTAAKKAAYDKVAAPLVKAQQQLASHAKAIGLLDEAIAAATRSGVKEEPVSGVIKLLQAKRQPVATQHAAAKVTVDKLTKSTAPQKAAWDKAVATEQPVSQKVQQLTQQRLAAESAFREAEQRAKSSRQQVYIWQAKLDEMNLLDTAADQRVKFEALRTAANVAQQQLAPVASRRDPVVKKHASQVTVLAKLESQRASVTQLYATARDRAATLVNAVSWLNDVNTALQQETVAADSDVAMVLKVTTSRVATLTNELKQKTAESEAAGQRLAALEKELKQVTVDIASTKSELAALDKQWAPLNAVAQSTKQQLEDISAQLDESRELMRAEWSRRFALTGLKSLTPEQLCWSVLEATGQIRIQATAAEAAINKKTPLSAEDLKDPAKVAARRFAGLVAGKAKLTGNVATFVKLFAAAAGQPQNEFFATADQALFLRNGSQLRGWIGAGGDTLYGRLSKLKDDATLADDMYLSILTRFPDEMERQDVINYLAVESAQRSAAIQEMIWALVTSIEFRFRH